MTTDFSLRDAANFFTSGPATPEEVTTSTSYRADIGPTIEAGRGLAPANPLNQNAGAGRGFINPKYALQTAPVTPATGEETTYNASIAQQESGGNANIGFHNREKSSAFGPYGTTAAGWQDARKVNPALPEDITKATPGQLTAGQNAYTQQNANYLKNYGVEVNDNTLAAAHFLGAKGLSDYMKTGYISPAAAAANGGEENVRRIVNARLSGQAAPASGATQVAPVSPEQAAQAETTQQAAPAYTGQGIQVPGQKYNSVLNSNSREELSKVAFGLDTPKYVSAAAFDKLYNTENINRNMEKARTQLAALGENPSPQALNKTLNDKETGSYARTLFYQLMGWEGKAKQELNKIMPDVKYSGTTLANGESYSVKFNKDTNEVMAAWDAQGKPVIDPAVLGSIAANGMGKKLDIVGGTYVNDTTGEVGRVVTDQNTGRSYIQTDTGAKPMTGFRPQSSQGTLENMRTRALQDLQIKLIGKTEEEKMAIIRPYNQELVKNGYQAIQPSEVGIKAPVVQGAPTATQPAPSAPVAPTAPAQAAPVVPGTPAATGQIPAQAAPAGTGPGGRPTGPEMARQAEVAKVEALGGPKAEAEGRESMVKESTKIAQQFPDLRNITDSVNKGIKIIDTGKVNIGPAGSIVNPETKANQLPFEKEAGKFLGTEDARNTKTVMDTVRKLAADGLKALGSNPSTVDLQFWTENKPTEYDSPEYVKEWLQTRRDDLERRIQYHKDVIKNKGVVPEVSPATPAQSGNKVVEEKTINGVTYVFDGKGWKKK